MGVNFECHLIQMSDTKENNQNLTIETLYDGGILFPHSYFLLFHPVVLQILV